MARSEFDKFDQYVEEPTQRMGEPSHRDIIQALTLMTEEIGAIKDVLSSAHKERAETVVCIKRLERKVDSLLAWKTSISAVSRQ